MNCTSWAGHKWGKWSEPKEVQIRNTCDGVVFGSSRSVSIQEHTCERCGLVQVRKVSEDE